MREVLRAAPGTAVLVFTTADDEDMVVTAVLAGARGYVLKSSADGGIVRAVTGLAAGETILGPGIADRLVPRIGSRSPRFLDMFPELTTREREVLELVAAGMGNSVIAKHLHLSPKTIANHISVIFGKLHVTSRAEATELLPEATAARGSNSCRVRRRPLAGTPSRRSPAPSPTRRGGLIAGPRRDHRSPPPTLR